MTKNITIIGVNYYPEDTAIGLYTTQKAEFLSKLGYNVSVVTGFPYYPNWKINQEYSKKTSFYKEIINNVKVHRYKQYVPKSPSFTKRIIHLCSFTLGSIINLFKIDKPNIVICIVPFTSSIVLGWLLKLRYKSKLWVHVQDFEFDAAIESNLISTKQNKLFKLLLSLESFLLNKADILSSISNAMVKKLKDKSVVSNINYIPNWISTSKFKKKTKHKFLNSNKFKILYSGNIGEKQDWELFIQFADALKNNKEIELILVGNGANSKKIKEQIKDHPNTYCYDLVPYDELTNLLSSADLHILFQKQKVLDTVMPSKILGMMGSAKPSIITGHKHSEVKTIIQDSKGGFYIDNNILETLIKTVYQLKNDKKLCLQIGENAKEFVFKNFSKEKIFNNLNKIIQNSIHD